MPFRVRPQSVDGRPERRVAVQEVRPGDEDRRAGLASVQVEDSARSAAGLLEAVARVRRGVRRGVEGGPFGAEAIRGEAVVDDLKGS